MRIINKLWGVFLLGFAASILVMSASQVQAQTYPDISADPWEWITNVTFGDINNTTSASAGGYGDYTDFSTTVSQGATVSLSVTIAPSSAEYITAFFDWNQDGDCNDPGESIVVLNGLATAGPHTVGVVVPPGAVSGNTRMRVILKLSSAPASSGSIGKGEVEDYTIVIKGFPWPMFLPAIIGKDTQPLPFSISSSSFSNNQVIPTKYTLYGTNTSPQLSWQNAPAGTASFMLTVIDPDGGNWLHWKVKLPGATTSLAENAGASGGASLPAGSIRYDNGFKGLGIPGADGTDYDGPRPPAGTGVHHYVFKVAALGAGGGELASAVITGTYELH